VLSNVSREGVLAAVAEFDEIGREAFLEKYGFGEARSYFLVINGRRYDSKAICCGAHGYDPGQGPPAVEDFSTVAEVLEQS
jgi:hypothetical protein